MRDIRLAAGFAAVSLVGCAVPQEGRLYRTDVVAVSRFRIANASALSTDAYAELSDGTACEGRVSRTDLADNAISPESESNATTDRSIAVLICRSRTVLRCKLVHRIADAYAFGECADQDGVKYTVIF